MPPKKGSAPSKKTEQKQKQKVIEDKTFGLKNKNKSTKVQKFITNVKTQVNNQGKKKKEEIQPNKPAKKREEEKEKAEINQLFKPVQKAPVGVDPKSILCQFHKQGTCAKGAKCKFSHDLDVGRKSEKIDVYTDLRDDDDDKEKEKELTEDVMDNWDQAKLDIVVNSKQTSENRNLKTDIVCKYFLDAIETKKYGWFWECPNGGGKCMYRHALPPGFELKKRAKDEPKDETPIEEIIENDRKRLTGEGTPVTLERFLAWKDEKRKRKEVDEKEKELKRKNDIKAGKSQMSGREMFVFNPDLFVDDDEALGEDSYVVQEDIDESIPHNIITVTNTSITRTRVTGAKENAEHPNQDNEETTTTTNEQENGNETENHSDGDNEKERDGDELETNNVDSLTADVDESLFIEDENIPNLDEE